MVEARTRNIGAEGLTHRVFPTPYFKEGRKSKYLHVQQFAPEVTDPTRMPVIIVHGWSEGAPRWEKEAEKLSRLRRDVWLPHAPHGIDYSQVYPDIGEIEDPILNALLRRTAVLEVALEKAQEHVGERPVALAAHSLGNDAAIFFASLHPDKVGAVVCNTLVGGLGSERVSTVAGRFGHEMARETVKDMRNRGRNLRNRLAGSAAREPVFSTQPHQVAAIALHLGKSYREVQLLSSADLQRLTTQVRADGVKVAWNYGTDDHAFPEHLRQIDNRELDIFTRLPGEDHNDIHRQPEDSMNLLNLQLEFLEIKSA